VTWAARVRAITRQKVGEQRAPAAGSRADSGLEPGELRGEPACGRKEQGGRPLAANKDPVSPVTRRARFIKLVELLRAIFHAPASGCRGWLQVGALRPVGRRRLPFSQASTMARPT